MKKETKEVLITSNIDKSVVVPEINESWGAEEITAQDIRIPKILLMQSLSQAVQDGKVDAGDFANSILLTAMGNCKTPKKEEQALSVVPIYIFKSWVICEEIAGKMEFLKIEPWTSHNANMPREEIVDGVKRQNNLTYNILCMLEKDLGDNTAFPYMISVNRMSSNFGKDVSSYAQKAQMINKPICIYTLKIGGEVKKNDKGSFFIWSLRGVSETKEISKYMETLKAWYSTFKAGKAVIDESDLTEDLKEEVPSEGFKGKF